MRRTYNIIAYLLAISTFIALLSVIVWGAPATLRYNPLRQEFTVTFDRGAVGLSIVCESSERVEPSPNWPDGIYRFRHSYWFDESDQGTVFRDHIDLTSESDADWTVWAEVQYQPKGKPEYLVRTNVVEVLK